MLLNSLGKAALTACMFASLSCFAQVADEQKNSSTSIQPVVGKDTPIVVPVPAPATTPTAGHAIEKVACCNYLEGLIKTKLPIDKFEFKLDESTPVWDFGNGPQAYLLLELPAYSKPYHFSLSNNPQAPGFFNKENFSQIAMRIETFDSNYVSKRLYKNENLSKRGLGFEKTVFINPNNDLEKYVLIYGDLKAPPETKTISEKAMTATSAGISIGLSVLVIAATGGRYIPQFQDIGDGVDRKIEIKSNDKGVIVVNPKGLQ